METGGLGSLFWLLVLGAFFYLMMRRGGCGGHAPGGHEERGESSMGHGRHGGEKAMGGLKDPVCGMAVEAAKAKSSVYGGETYCFCSNDCRERFEAEPASYAGKTRGGGCC
jgi:YHS domain-containing protein